jgi:glycosyltransferase involved in cell wall biosynthesis
MSHFSSTERIAISSMVAINYGLPKTSVVENPIDLSAYRSLSPSRDARCTLGLPSDGRLVVLVGRINRWKGQDKFLRAASAIPRESGAHFVIAGAPRFRDADFLPELRAMAETPHLRGRVTFLDWMDDPRDIFAAADLNVNCSIREPFGRTVIEAAAAGVPTVCFDDAGVAEFMVEENIGTVVPAGDERQLYAALLRQICMDDASLKRERDAARRWANRFDATRHAIRVAAILERASRRR